MTAAGGGSTADPRSTRKLLGPGPTCLTKAPRAGPQEGPGHRASAPCSPAFDLVDGKTTNKRRHPAGWAERRRASMDQRGRGEAPRVPGRGWTFAIVFAPGGHQLDDRPGCAA